MFLLTEIDILNFSSSIIFNRGYDYYRNHAVYELDVSSNKTFYSEVIYNVVTKVEGSQYSPYEVFVSIKENEGIINYECDCEYYYSHKRPCKHIVAALLKYIKEYQNSSLMKKNNFIDKLKYEFIDISEKKELKLDIHIDITKQSLKNIYSINLKIGEKKLYIVKNIKNLLNAIINKTSLQFGKNFTYDFNKHKFNEIDQKIIDTLIEFYEDSKPFERYAHLNHYIETFNKKEVNLNESQFKRLLKHLSKRNFNGLIFEKFFENIEVLNEKIPIEFNIQKTDEGVKIAPKKNLPIPITSDGSFFAYHEKIYSPPDKQRKIYIHFYNNMLKSNCILVNKSDYENLGKFIIPALSEVSSKITTSEDMNNIIKSSPLKSKIFLDKTDDNITIKVIYEYDNLKINPLVEDTHTDRSEIIVRNTRKERTIISTIEKYHFSAYDNDFILKDEDKIIDFIYSGIDELQDNCEVYYSESFKNVKIHSSSSISSSVRINNNDLLEFTFNIVGVEKTEFKDILCSIKTKKKYHRLKNGGFVLLDSPEFKDFIDTINYLGIKNTDFAKEKIILPKYNSIYLNEKLKSNKNIKVEKNKKFRETVSNIKDIHESDFRAPEHIHSILREYQKTGFKWFKTLSFCGFGGILADEMGLGKTLQAISFISSLKESGEKEPVLVVCPTSLVYNWESEINKFAPELNCTVISGHKNIRHKKFEDINDFDVVITSYPLIRTDIHLYKDMTFTCCFLDEAQHIKNPSSLNAKSVKEINSKCRFALTGTPIENSLTELWSIFDFIMPGYLLGNGTFKKLYETPIVKNHDEKALNELNKHIKPFILRRHKKEVIKELPPKIEHKFILDLNDEQKKLYASYVQSFKEEIETEIKENGLSKSKIKILSLLTRLRQICCDPSIFVEDYRGSSSKIDTLCELVENSLSENHRLLIFSQFTSILKNIKDIFKDKNISSLYLDGSTPSEKRIEMVNDFNNGTTDVFLISLKAGGTGLNLTGADTVIHFDPWWNPAVEEQATDRAHRIGQKKTVEVIKLITKGTIEEKISKLQEKKKDIFDNIVENAANQNILSSMSEDEIKELFNI